MMDDTWVDEIDTSAETVRLMVAEEYPVTTTSHICECGVRSYIRGGKCIRCNLNLI